jgi:hypothetical protein
MIPRSAADLRHIAKVEGEPGIKPDGLLDDHRWEAISGVADLGHDRRLTAANPAGKPSDVTMPFARSII